MDTVSLQRGEEVNCCFVVACKETIVETDSNWGFSCMQVSACCWGVFLHKRVSFDSDGVGQQIFVRDTAF